MKEILIVLASVGTLLVIAPTPTQANPSQSKPLQLSSSIEMDFSCEYDSSLEVLADTFISKCCLSSVRRRFPGEYLYESLETIKSKRKTDRAAKTAYKLLNDDRFRK